MIAKIPLLANEFIVIYESFDPVNLCCYSPGIARCPNGRLIATCDLDGPAVENLPGPKGVLHTKKSSGFVQGKLWVLDDHGLNWEHRLDFPFIHARPFVAGKALYILGHCGRLAIMRSDDMGDTWSDVSYLTETDNWHAAPCNVHYANNKVYLVMEHLEPNRCSFSNWPPSHLAPIVMSARIDADLTEAQSWTFSNTIYFAKAVKKASMIGVPFWPPGPLTPDNPIDPRVMPPLGWLETNIVQFTDPNHVWYDPTGKTFHLWMRANTGISNLACIAKAVEDDNGQLTVMLEKSPSGKTIVFVPCPGGYMKFHILFDEFTNMFWLLSSLSKDSMTRPECLPAERWSIPTAERDILALYFSKNCMDWCLAGIVAQGNSAKEARHYASMVIDGDDLHILSRSGDRRAKSAHDGNLITFHTVKNFRELIY